MNILIKGMEMPKSGVYEISIDNTSGRDKTVMTVYKRKDNGFIHVFGSYELVPVPPHGRLIDAGTLQKSIHEHDYEIVDLLNSRGTGMFTSGIDYAISVAPTIIEAEE